MTIAILSWKSHETLINTLDSYKGFGLNDEQKLIYFQDITSTDKDIARRYGYDYIGSHKNVGIADALKELVQATTGEFFLFLENDWKLIERPQVQLIASALYIKHEGADLVKLRHRENPGLPLWSRQFEGSELTRSEFLLESVHWTEPAKKFPAHVQAKNIQLQVQEGVMVDNIFSTTTSKYANWSNNPYITTTQFLKDNVVPRLEGDVERAIQGWWQEQSFVVAHANPGLFTHERLDR